MNQPIPPSLVRQAKKTPHSLTAEALFSILLALAVLFPLAASTFHVQLLTSGLILGITAMSFALLAGFGGMLSLAQMAFYGMAAYVIAITTKTYDWPHGLSVPIAILAAMGLSGLFGFIAVRASGVYFLIMTLALSQMFYGVALQWQSVTGGYNGIAGIERPSFAGLSLANSVTLFYVALTATAACYLLLRALLRTPYGLTLSGIRDNPLRMSALGYRVQLHRWLMVVISGGVAGLAGVLGTYNHGVVNPDVAGLTASVLVVLSALLGGVSNLLGPILGAVIVTSLLSMVSFFMQQWFGTSRYWTFIGAVFVLVVFFLPNGLLGGSDALRRLRRARPRG